MSARAKITQADVLRVMKSIKLAGIEDARVVIRFEHGEIEVIIGHAGQALAVEAEEEWADDDY